MKVLELLKNLNHEVINLFHDSIKSSLLDNGIYFDDLRVSVSLHEGKSVHVDCNISQEGIEKTYTICTMTDGILYALCDTSVYGKYHDENQSVMETISESATVEDVVQRFVQYITHR
uniref:Uncharacterized protein n=1 Tax=Ackermannviridae sp. TaxID=2831612 RepID=A0A8S5VU99_9CAUD|nr:MAG TPA: hypothetical protein [Ackermannviridae sp.]